MANVTHFLRSLAPDELDDDLATAGRSRPSKRGGEAKSRSGSSKGKQKLRGYAEIGQPIDIIALTEEYSMLPRTQSPNYYMHPHFAWERAQQRAIRPGMTMACLQYGHDSWHAEATHRMVTDRSIAKAAEDGFDISSLRGLTLVIIGRNHNVIKTGYKVRGRQGRLAA